MATRRLATYISVTLITLIVAGFAWILTSKSIHSQGVAHSATSTAVPYGCSQDFSTTPTTPGIRIVGVTGSPAIGPHLSGDESFTLDEAKAYVVHDVSAASSIPISFSRADFMTSEQACVILQGIQSGVLSNQIVCLVMYYKG